jgi:hypothetical protein
LPGSTILTIEVWDANVTLDSYIGGASVNLDPGNYKLKIVFKSGTQDLWVDLRTKRGSNAGQVRLVVYFKSKRVEIPTSYQGATQNIQGHHNYATYSGNPQNPAYVPQQPIYSSVQMGPQGFPPQQGYSIPPQGYPPQQGYPVPPQGYPPQQGYAVPPQGYPPQQGYSIPPQGYPPQQGYAVPPQGYPPQQGYSIPPQGYPPQQGYAVPPQGYPPQQGYSIPPQGYPAQQGYSIPPQGYPPQQGYAAPPQGGYPIMPQHPYVNLY